MKIDIGIYYGPIDLLVYLVRQKEVDIFDIPIAQIAEEYLDYIRKIERDDLEDAADFLLMAAILIRLKVRYMLPRTPAEDDEVDVLGPLPCTLQRLPRRRQRDVRGAHVVRRPPPRADRGRLLHLVDELREVGEPLPQLVVGHLDLGQVPPGRHNGRVSGHESPVPVRARSRIRPGHCHVPITSPPSTDSVMPVIQLAASDASHT